ncbi:MAG: hypothetical protein EOP53_13645 [Sphingobacteriales bacterium]|nr:MAG: hypothetical protein EOP53_13645 [Sphingobacteriales bacterium]
MKTEDFDDAIRKKVNSIYHTYKEEDIDKVHNYVSRKKTVAVRARYVKMLAFSAVAVLVAGLFMWNMMQLREKQELAAKIDTLQNEIAQNANVKTDTVYLEKYITKSESSKNIVEENTAENTSRSINSIEINNGGNGLKNDKLAENTTRNLSYGNFKNERLTTGKSADKKQNSTLQKSAQKHFPGDAYMKKTPLANNRNQQENINRNDRSKIGEEVNVPIKKYELTKTIDLTNDSAYVVSEKNASDSVIVLEEKPMAENNMPEEQNMESKNESQKVRKSFSLKKLHYNIGLEAERALRHDGGSLGLVAQVFFTDRIGISTGIRMNNFGYDRFRDPRDFRMREGKDFAEVCGPKLVDTNAVENIERRISIIQLPVNLVYVQPLKNDFGLVFSAGTNINLAGRQFIGFDNLKRTDRDRKQDINVKLPVSPFNNATLSVGVQKKWSNVVLQASPFATMQFKREAYKMEPFTFGLNLKLMYSL